jgi:RNA polymerase sigma-70 factor, ECF subfamily
MNPPPTTLYGGPWPIDHTRQLARRRRKAHNGDPQVTALPPRSNLECGRSRESSVLARRSVGRPGDDEGVTHPQVRPDPAFGLLKLYDDALPRVYGYLLARCGDTGLAEELTAESFLAAVHAARKPGAPDPSIPWLIGVARHKLADHWRRVERERRGLRMLDGEPGGVDDPWETLLDRIRAREVLGRLGPHHRAALTLQVPFSSGHPGAWRTDETTPPLSILSSQDAEPEAQLSYRVDDIAAAVERVRAAGRHADQPVRRPFGLLADCVDDQGATFRLWQPAD